MGGLGAESINSTAAHNIAMQLALHYNVPLSIAVTVSLLFLLLLPHTVVSMDKTHIELLLVSTPLT